jgi:hypothetical protein
MKKIIFYISTLLVCLSCKQQNTETTIPKKEKKNTVAEQKKEISSTFLDTTIVLQEFTRISSTRKKLTQEKAATILYKYFKARGVIPKSEFKPSIYSYDQLCVSYDTIYNFKTSKLPGCIISYWLGPADLNGHCFQPSKAVILNTKTGYKLGHENFIPTNFAIDSIINSSIYGYDYECGGRGVLRNFKVTLK